MLDTCVLLSPRVADVLMDLRAEKLFFAHWTATIDSEFMRHMPRLFNATQAQAASRLMAMKKRCPEWEIELSNADFTQVPSSVDSGDRHVAAAAIAVRNLPDSDRNAKVLLVTENLRDMAPTAMARLGIQVLRPGAFLDELYMAFSKPTTRAVLRAAGDLKNPPYTVAELLFALKRQGAKALAAGMAEALQVKPVKKDKLRA